MPRGTAKTSRSASFHGRATASDQASDAKRQLSRPRTQPNLFSGKAKGENMKSVERVPVMEKVLVNINVQRSVGSLHVMASTEWTVEKLIEVAVKLYVKEGRRPLLQSMDPGSFGLHYSQFSLESLDPKEKLIGLGSRNFFLCPKPVAEAASVTSSSSCSKEAEKGAFKIGLPWLRFMGFSL